MGYVEFARSMLSSFGTFMGRSLVSVARYEGYAEMRSTVAIC
jgi:hypothetical protein